MSLRKRCCNSVLRTAHPGGASFDTVACRDLLRMREVGCLHSIAPQPDTRARDVASVECYPEPTTWGCVMEFGFGLLMGFAGGYLVREIVSRRRHLRARQRRRMGADG